MPKKAVVIGAGIGGLAAAIRLAVKGYAVEVYEKNTYAGGKLAELEDKGYRWDMGPSLFTLPELVDELFALARKNPRDYFQYQRLDRLTRYFYEDGLVLDAWADEQKFAQEVERKTAERAENVLQYLKKSERKYCLTEEVFLHRSLHRFSTYVSPAALKAYFHLRKLEAFVSLHRMNATHFRDARIIQLFDRFATYNGSNPYAAPATLSIIPHLEHHLGAYFPVGGMYSIVEALVRLAEELGVKFTFNQGVDEIVVENTTATGVRRNGQFQPYDLVVSNADVRATYRNLLPKVPAPSRFGKEKPSSSAYIFYWGIGREFEELHLHNIFFSANYLKEFYDIFEKNQVYYDPTVYVNISSKMNPADASQGKENWFVMVNVPPDNGQDWKAIGEELRHNILQKLNRLLRTRVDSFIEAEHTLTPADIEARTSSWGGALYGSASHSPMSAFFRHPNFHGKIKNLLFVGGSVHPGGGIPLSLLSAKIAVG